MGRDSKGDQGSFEKIRADNMKNKLRAKIVIEIFGTPKEWIESGAENVVKHLGDEQGVKLLKKTIYKAKRVKIGWNVTSSSEIEIESISKLIRICFDYMPSSIKILNPHKICLKTKAIEDIFNDLLTQLHKNDSLLAQHKK